MLHFLVRLACVRHAASVDSEPGSNSRLKPDLTPVSKETRAASRRVVMEAAVRLMMPTRVDTEFTAQPLTYFVRSLGLESSFHSRLARSTILSKINRGFRLGGSLSTFDRSAYADLSSKPAVSMRPQPLETNPLTIARFAAVRQLTFHSLLTLLIPLRPSAKERCSTSFPGLNADCFLCSTIAASLTRRQNPD